MKQKKKSLVNKWFWEIWSNTCKNSELRPLFNAIHKAKVITYLDQKN